MKNVILEQRDGAASAGSLEQLRLLADLSQEFVHSLNINETLQAAVTRICEYMEAEAASIFLLDPKTGQLICRASAGPVDVTDMQVNIEQSIVGVALTSCQCQMIKDARQNSKYVRYVDSLTGFETKSVLCTPLLAAGQAFGVLQVLNKQDSQLFNNRDRDILRVLASPIALAIQNARLTLDFVEQKRIRKELTLARRLQRSLLPERERPPFPLVGSNVAANEVSGDFYDYFTLDDGRVGFIIGDVSGKGLDASMLMVRTSSLLRWIGKDKLEPGEWLHTANRELCKNVSRGLFICAAVGYYFPARDEVVWSNAGLPPVIHKCPAGQVQTWVADAPPLAISPDIEFPQQRIQLNQGGLYFVTDGLTDARCHRSERLQTQGLIKLIQATESESPELRIGKIISTVRRQFLNDDATILLLEKRDHLSEQVLRKMEFKAEPCELKQVRQTVSEVCMQAGFDCSLTQKLTLCLDEAITNVIRHAYKKHDDGRIKLKIKLQNNTLVFYLRDFAPEVYDNSIKPRDLEKPLPGQMGISFIDRVMDSWEFATPKDGYGNLLIMKKEKPAAVHCDAPAESK